MGAAVLVNSGEVQMLTSALSPRLFLRLYQLPQAVTWESRLGDFSIADFPGYEDLEITDSWPAPQIDGTGQAYSQPNVFVWTRTSSGPMQTVYGWLLYQDEMPDGVLVAGNLFSIPLQTMNAGDVVTLNLMVVLLRG